VALDLFAGTRLLPFRVIGDPDASSAFWRWRRGFELAFVVVGMKNPPFQG
jgi:hypothetical protein